MNAVFYSRELNIMNVGGMHVVYTKTKNHTLLGKK